MSRPKMLGIGLLFLAVVGCVKDAFLAHSTNSARYVQVVDGTPGLVASVLEQGFSGVGVIVFVKRQGEEVRLAGQAKSGQIFCVYVRPDKAAPAKSMVTVKWDRQPDEQLGESIVQWLATCAPEKSDSSKDS